MMQDPRPRLEGFIHEGRRLLASYKQQVPSRRAQNLTADLGSELVADMLGVRRSGFGRTVGRAVIQSNARQKEVQFEASFRQWEYNVQSFLNQVSVAKASLSVQGNSAELVGRFTGSMKGAKAETQLGQAVRFLERLHGQSLVYNGEITDLLKQRQEEKLRDQRLKAELKLMDIPSKAPGFDHLKFPNRAALHEELAEYPEERQMIEGAMDAYLGDGPDRYRQALSSARSALESMARRITGEEKWRNAIRAVAGDSTKNIFRDAYDFLSSRGVHASKAPSKADTRLGIQQALTCMIWLISNRSRFEDAVKPAQNS